MSATSKSIRVDVPRWATSLIFLLNGLGIGVWAAAIPHFKQHLALSDGQLSLALLAFAVGAVVAMPLAGMLGGRIGTRNATASTALAFGIAMALPVFVTTLPGLIGVALLLGASNGGLDVSMNAHASEIETRRGRAIMSSFHAAFSLGGLLGAALGAALGAVAAMCSIAASIAVLTLAMIPLLGMGLRSTLDGAKPAVADELAPRLALPSGAMLGLCLMAMLCMLVEGAMADWSGVYVASVTTGQEAATGYAAFSLAMTAARICGDRVVNVLGRERVIRYGAGLAALGLVAIAVAPSFSGLASSFALMLGFIGVGLGLANVVPAIFSAAARRAKHASVGVAMAATAGYAGFLAGPPCIGVVASFAGLRNAMALLALLGIGIVLLAGSKATKDAGSEPCARSA